MRPSIKRKLSIILVLILLVMPLTISISEDINHGSGDDDGSTGKGSSEWAYTTRGRGIRIGIYFVEGNEDNFANGIRPAEQSESEENGKPYVQRIGKVTDFAKCVIENLPPGELGINWTVEVYTGMSVFDYMNGSGREYKKRISSVNPYKW